MDNWTFDPPSPPGLRLRKPGGMPRSGDGNEGPMSTSSIPAANGACTQQTLRYLQPNTSPVHHSTTDTSSISSSYQLEETVDQHSTDGIGCSSGCDFHQTQGEPGQCSTGLGYTISSDAASQCSDLQLEEDQYDPSPNGCDSCQDFHQIHNALPRAHRLPTGLGDTNCPEQLEEDFVDPFPDGCASCKVFHQIQGALALIQLLPPGSVQSKTLRLNGSLVQPSPTVDIFHRSQRVPVQVSPEVPEAANSSNQLDEFRWNSPWIFPCNLSRVMKFLSPLRKRIELLSISIFIASFFFRILSIQPISV